MKRLRFAAPSLLVLIAGVAAAGSSARTVGGPFYLVPSPTKECQNVSNCKSVFGPWVVVPAKGEATYLFACKTRRDFVIGGTDARASSTNVRVWFDGRLGAPIGLPSGKTSERAVLLFHAVTNNGQPGSFQPVLGCVSLRPASKRATVSARLATATPGTPPSPPLDLRANDRVISQPTATIYTACPKSEQLVGSWTALSFATVGPPARQYAGAAKISSVVTGGKVQGTFEALGTLLTPLAPTASVQIGAMCEP